MGNNDELKDMAAAAAMARKMDELPEDQQALLADLLGKVAKASDLRRGRDRARPAAEADADQTGKTVELPTEQTQR